MRRDRPGRHGRPLLPAALVVGLIALSLGVAGLVVPAPAQSQTLPTRTPLPEATDISGEEDRATRTPTPSPAPAPSVSPGPVVSPTVAGTPTPIASPSGGCELVITDDDLAGGGSVSVGDAPLDGLPNRDPRYTYIRACEVIYTDGGGQIITNKIFDGPIEVCFRYTPNDVARAGGDPARLTVVYYDETTGQWVELEVVLDTTNGLICGRLPRSGIVALVIRSGQVPGLPNTSGEIPEGVPTSGAAPAAGGTALATTQATGTAPAGAPAAGGANPAAGRPAPAATGGDTPAAAPVVSGAAAPAPLEPTAGGLGPVLALVLGVIVAVVAAIVALSRSMLPRARDE